MSDVLAVVWCGNGSARTAAYCTLYILISYQVLTLLHGYRLSVQYSNRIRRLGILNFHFANLNMADDDSVPTSQKDTHVRSSACLQIYCHCGSRASNGAKRKPSKQPIKMKFTVAATILASASAFVTVSAQPMFEVPDCIIHCFDRSLILPTIMYFSLQLPGPAVLVKWSGVKRIT
jgi:hypothetical protein